MQISSYILVAVTVNRFTIMFNRTIFCKQKRQQPNNSKQSIKSVIWIFSSIVFIVSLLNLHFLIYYELIGSEDKQRRNQEDCSINKKNHEYYFKFRDQIFGQIHLHLFIVFPCFILFIMNILIIRKLMQSKITLNSKPNIIHNFTKGNICVSNVLINLTNLSIHRDFEIILIVKNSKSNEI